MNVFVAFIFREDLHAETKLALVFPFPLVELLDSDAILSNTKRDTQKDPTQVITQGPTDIIMTDYANRSRTKSDTEQVFSILPLSAMQSLLL
jgi:hypothetical protein